MSLLAHGSVYPATVKTICSYICYEKDDVTDFNLVVLQISAIFLISTRLTKTLPSKIISAKSNMQNDLQENSISGWPKSCLSPDSFLAVYIV